MEEMMSPGLVVVDMQRYYLEAESDFSRFHESRDPGATRYIQERARETVIPNIQLLLSAWRRANLPVFYLRLCGNKEDRSDLHRFFRNANRRGEAAGYPAIYPLASDPMSEVSPDISPETGDAVFCKTTFSGFSSGYFADGLLDSGIRELVFTGLATSQCVETTARDASDRGYRVVQIEDAQADYSEAGHRMSLLSSRGVCGGAIVQTTSMIQSLPDPGSLTDLFDLAER